MKEVTLDIGDIRWQMELVRLRRVEIICVGLAYTWESGGVLAVLGFSSFPTEALALPT